MSNKKNGASLVPNIITIIAAVALIAILLVQSSGRMKEQIAAIDDLNAQLSAAQEELTTLKADLAAANLALTEKDAELAESAGRLTQAETALTEVLAVVQVIRNELNAVEAPLPEPAAEEAAEPTEEVSADEYGVVESNEITAAPAAEEAAEEQPAEEVPAEEATEEQPAEEVPAEEATEEQPAEEVPAEEATEEQPAEENT